LAKRHVPRACRDDRRDWRELAADDAGQTVSPSRERHCRRNWSRAPSAPSTIDRR
jgi:hypothetical protein